MNESDHIANCWAGIHDRGALLLIAAAFLFASYAAIAGEADVVSARAVQTADDTRNFEATLRCDDRGFDYFCDRFEILSPNGAVLAVRVLDHPHVDEQPFTRELTGVRIHTGLARSILIRAHHNVRGYSGEALKLPLLK